MNILISKMFAVMLKRKSIEPLTFCNFYDGENGGC